MIQTLLMLVFGFLLGLKHSFEPDHVIAVSTLVTEHKSPIKAAFIGAFWGIGHTATLFVIGFVVLILKISIPERLNLFAELVVGIMLVFLGIRAISQARFVVHTHSHDHKDMMHSHIHAHRESEKAASHRRKSFLIGVFHGLAGSGALMVLVIATIPSVVEGIYYILLFGLGSVFGMTLMSFLIGLPLAYSMQKCINIEKYLRNIAGGLSVLFGVYIMYVAGSSMN